LQPENFGEVIDPFGGLLDLEKKILRTPLDPDITYSDDPLRMMRAVRFANQLHFRIEQDSFDAIKRNSERLKIVSMERITTELNKIILCAKPSIGFKILRTKTISITRCKCWTMCVKHPIIYGCAGLLSCTT
jgi:tRNA nucleotidyltransferase (CCA-adding enzyme)